MGCWLLHALRLVTFVSNSNLSAQSEIMSRLCKRIVSLTYLTRASVKSIHVGKRLEQFSSTFGEGLVTRWLDLDMDSIMEDSLSAYNMN